MKRDAASVAPNADIALWHNTDEFFHKGSNGQWRDVFTPAHLERYEERVAQLASPDLAAWLHGGSTDLRQPRSPDAVAPARPSR
jgi:aryl sulfotransferase